MQLNAVRPDDPALGERKAQPVDVVWEESLAAAEDRREDPCRRATIRRLKPQSAPGPISWWTKMRRPGKK